ncbi:MAG: hypothetical protein BAJATHORv1_120007 [Candidatus Thorarchaeota archaeon]|nr:MAG: hypothetical protein BAJATHORv1_120007 [Candidatus Thorarchaeota archaeon]
MRLPPIGVSIGQSLGALGLTGDVLLLGSGVGVLCKRHDCSQHILLQVSI